MEAVVINNRVPEYLVKTAVSVAQRGNGEQVGKLVVERVPRDEKGIDD